MLEVTAACPLKDIPSVVDSLRGYPKQRRLLDELYTEDTGDFVRTVRSILWQINHAKRQKSEWAGHFVLHRRGRVRFYGF